MSDKAKDVAVPAQSAPTPVCKTCDGRGYVWPEKFKAGPCPDCKPIPPTSAPFKDGGYAAPTEPDDYIRGWNEALRNAENVLWDEGWLGDSVTRIRALAKESK